MSDRTQHHVFTHIGEVIGFRDFFHAVLFFGHVPAASHVGARTKDFDRCGLGRGCTH